MKMWLILLRLWHIAIPATDGCSTSISTFQSAASSTINNRREYSASCCRWFDFIHMPTNKNLLLEYLVNAFSFFPVKFVMYYEHFSILLTIPFKSFIHISKTFETWFLKNAHFSRIPFTGKRRGSSINEEISGQMSQMSVHPDAAGASRLVMRRGSSEQKSPVHDYSANRISSPPSLGITQLHPPNQQPPVSPKPNKVQLTTESTPANVRDWCLQVGFSAKYETRWYLVVSGDLQEFTTRGIQGKG